MVWWMAPHPLAALIVSAVIGLPILLSVLGGG
jgi:hypothetical protein